MRRGIAPNLTSRSPEHFHCEASAARKKKITHAAIDRFRASTAAGRASTAAGGSSWRARFQDIIDFCKELAPRGEKPTMPAVLSREALADLARPHPSTRRRAPRTWPRSKLCVPHPNTSSMPRARGVDASRLGHGVDADDATRPATIERYVDRLATRGRGRRQRRLPSTRRSICRAASAARGNVAAAHEAPLPLLVVALARGQDVPDLLGRAAARGDGVGLPRGSSERDLGLCALR